MKMSTISVNGVWASGCSQGHYGNAMVRQGMDCPRGFQMSVDMGTFLKSPSLLSTSL